MSLSSPSTSIPVLYSQMLIREAKPYCHNAHEAIKGTGLSLQNFEDPEYKITPLTQDIILHNVLQKIPSSSTDLAFNLGSKLQTSSHGTIGILLLSSPNIQCMFEQFVKYAAYSLPFGLITHEENDSHLILVLGNVLPARHHEFYYGTAAASIQKSIEDVLGCPITGGHLHLPYAPKDSAAYIKHFHHPVSFSSPRFEYHIPKGILLTPSPLYNHDLYQYTAILCEQRTLPHEQNNVITEKVRSFLFSSHTRNWTLIEIAKKLNMSERSLYRKLNQENSSYKSIYDDVRKSLTQNYLTDTDLSINQITELLGFNDPSNFRRIFKRWFGMSPTQYIATLNNKSKPH
jgi:AraC-like DNA-binding protein